MADINRYAARLRSGSDKFEGMTDAQLVASALRAYSPNRDAEIDDAGLRDWHERIRTTGQRPDGITEADLPSSNPFATFGKGMIEGVDPTGLLNQNYAEGEEVSIGRIAGNLIGALGSSAAIAAATGPGAIPAAATKIKTLMRLIKLAKAASQSKKGQAALLGLDVAQGASGAISEGRSFNTPIPTSYAGGGAAAGGVGHVLSHSANPWVRMAGSGISAGAQIFPSPVGLYRDLEENTTDPAKPTTKYSNPVSRHFGQTAEILTNPEYSAQEKGMTAAFSALPVGFMALAARGGHITPPRPNVQQPPSGAAAAAPVKPTPRERTVSSVTEPFVPTSDKATEVARSGDMYSMLQDMQNKLNPDRKALPAPEINTVDERGNVVPLLGFRGRDRVITGNGDTHDPVALVRNQTQVMRIPLGGNTHDVVIDPGFMPGHNPSTLQPGIFAHKETKQPFIIVGNDPTNGTLLVYDPKTGKYYDGPPEVFPGAELVGKASETTMDAEATRKANIEVGKRKEANRLERAGLPTQPHKATTFDDLDRQWLEIKKQMGWQPPMPSHNKFGE